ncbi:MAG: TonB-dependent receptor plug domain-containing protein [Candidatus Acidiferrales bacterium]
MRLERLPAIPAGILLATIWTQTAFARTQSTATLTGHVTDPSDAVITGAKIAAEPLDSAGKPATTQSGREGNFSLALAPGRYRVSIRYASFAPAEEQFTLAAGETRTWNVRLELEKLSSNVVVTATAEPMTAQMTPALVDIITKQEIDQRQDIWLIDSLTAQEGASFARLGRFGGIASYFLDGGNSDYTKVLVDGTPVNEPGGAVDFSNLTDDDVDKIEVVHGASSALYGSDAMDGVIQIFTHRGTTPTPELVVEGEGGTFDTGRGSGQLSGLLGAFDYSVGSAYFATSGQGPDDYFRDATQSGNFGWKFSDTDSLRLTLRNSSSDAGQLGQTLLASVYPGQHSDLHDFSSNLNWNFATGEHWQYQVNGYESRFQDAETTPPFIPFVDAFNRAGFDGQATYLFGSGSATAGYMNEVETGAPKSRHNQAGYVEVQRRFGQRFTAVAGGRVEANGFFGTRTVPRVGGEYALRQGGGLWGATRLRASYGLGIKEPELLPPDCSPLLNAEQSTTFDAGIDQAFASDRVHLSATYFHNDFRDIVSFEFGVPSPNCPAFGGSFFNTDKARAFGSNVTLDVRALRWLAIVAHYTYDDTRVLKTTNPLMDPALAVGNRLFFRPLNSANIAFNVHLRGVNWRLTGYYVGCQTDSDFLGLGITSIPSYVRLDMAMIVPLRGGLSATAHFENLLDRHYQDAVGYPALGYNYLVGLKYVWGGERNQSQ